MLLINLFYQSLKMDLEKDLRINDYRVTNRGGKGIIGIINSPRNGNIASSLVVSETDEILLSTGKGSIMRCRCKRNQNSW